MSLATLKSRILNSTLYVAREGDTHSSTETVARASKPPYNDAAWLDFGIVKDADFTLEDIKAVEILAPAGGQLVPYDEIKAGTRLTLKLTVSEFNYLHLEHVFGSLKLASSATQANPLEGTTKRGWIKCMLNDQDVAAGGTPTITLDVWCRIKCAGSLKAMGGDPAEAQLEALVLHSIYNTMAF